MTEVALKQRTIAPVDLGRVKLAEHERQNWVANIPEGVTVDDVKDPAFWSFVSARMRPYDRIEMRSEDGTWVAEALVLSCDRTWAKIHVLQTYQLTTQDASMTECVKHEVRYRGPHRKWSVVRLTDQTPVRDSFETRIEAFKWMNEFEKVV